MTSKPTGAISRLKLKSAGLWMSNAVASDVSQLWAAMILQALDDIDAEPYYSTDYGYSVALFTRDGHWGRWRQEVAAMVNLHPDDLRRQGRVRIAARELREPPPPKPVRTPWAPVVAVAATARPPSPPRRLANGNDRNRRNGDWVRRFIANEGRTMASHA
jgi:hypothetical protein